MKRGSFRTYPRSEWAQRTIVGGSYVLRKRWLGCPSTLRTNSIATMDNIHGRNNLVCQT
jgi:hypothetical protein